LISKLPENCWNGWGGHFFFLVFAAMSGYVGSRMSAAGKRAMPGTARPKPPDRAKVTDLGKYGVGGPAAAAPSASLTQRARLVCICTDAVCVCMYVCTYVCMYICMYVFMHACMHACVCACVCARVRACACIRATESTPARPDRQRVLSRCDCSATPHTNTSLRQGGRQADGAPSCDAL